MAIPPLMLLLAVQAFAAPQPAADEAPESPRFTHEDRSALAKHGWDPKLLDRDAVAKAGGVDALVAANGADYTAFNAWHTDPALIVEASRKDPEAVDETLTRLRAFVSPEKLRPLETLLESNRRLAPRGVSAPVPAASSEKPAAGGPSPALSNSPPLSGGFRLADSPLLSNAASPTGTLSSDFKGGPSTLRLSAVPPNSPRLSAAPAEPAPWWESEYNYYLCKYLPAKCPTP